MCNPPLVEITGASGFVGTNLFKILKAHTIRKSLRVEQPFVIDAEVVIHLAGIADARSSSNSVYDYAIYNTYLTKKVFDAFLYSNARKLIIISSVKAVADEYDGILSENLHELPTTNYGKSKLDADRYVLSCSLPVGKSVYVLRPAIITGPGVKGNLQRFKKYAHLPLGWVLSAFDSKRSFCNIKNLGFVIQQIIDREDIPSGVYLLADDEPLSAAQIRLVLSGRASEYPPLKVLAHILKFGFIIFSKLFPIMGIHSVIRTLDTSYLVSNQKIVSALGIKLPFTSRDGIESMKLKV